MAAPVLAPAPSSVGRLVRATVLAVVVLGVAVALSVAFGSRPIPLGTVLDTVRSVYVLIAIERRREGIVHDRDMRAQAHACTWQLVAGAQMSSTRSPEKNGG